jgi:hypothetical protein
VFRAFTPRPRPTVEAIHVTASNLDVVADHLTGLGFPVTIEDTPRRRRTRRIVTSLPNGNGDARTYWIGPGRVIVRHHDGRYSAPDADEHYAEYQLTTPVSGTTPELVDVPKVAAAVRVLVDAGHRPAEFVGLYAPGQPHRDITGCGFVVLSLPLDRVGVYAETTTPGCDLDGYEAALTAAGYQVGRARDGHLVATSPR